MRTIIARGLLSFLLPGFFPAICAGDAKGVVTGTVNHASVQKYQTVVYIEDAPGQQSTPSTNPTMDQRGKLFLPRVLPVLIGTTVEFFNSDSFKHNVFSPDGEKYDLGEWDKGGKASYTFKRPGVYTQLCKLHPDMVGYVLVLQTPYFAAVDGEGEFRIPNVPVGTWKLKVWNERLRPIQTGRSYDVKVAAGQEAKVDVTF